jgi:hypothetical protein
MATDLMGVLQQHLDGAPLDQTLAQLAQDDPQLAPLVQLLAQREHELETDLERHEREDEEERLRAAEEEATRRATMRLREHVEVLTSELEVLRQSLESLGLALGACPTCLGADEGCPLCHGRGLPGSLPPDEDAFDQLVLPAVRARAYVRARHRPGVPPDDQSTQERSAP